MLSFFLAFEVITIAIGSALYWGAFQSTLGVWYGWYWLLTRIGLAVVFFSVLIEAFQRMLAPYEGFRRLSRLLIYLAFGAVSAFVLWLAVIDQDADLRTWRGLWLLEERTIYVALTLATGSLLFFAAYLRVRPNRNVKVIFSVCGVWFASQAALWTLRAAVGKDFLAAQGIAAPIVFLLTFGAGAFLFAPEEEPETSPEEPSGDRGEPALERLHAINQTLLRVLQR